MFRSDAGECLDRLPRRHHAQLAKLAAAVLFSTTLIGLSPATAQSKKPPDVFYGVQVNYKGTVDAEVFITDWYQGQKEILHTTMPAGKTITVKAKARMVRPTQHTPETDIRWKVISRKHDENGIPLKPGDKTSKILSWCGAYNTHHDNTPIDIGFKGSGHGRAC